MMFLYNYSALITWTETIDQTNIPGYGGIVMQGRKSGDPIPVSIIAETELAAHVRAVASLPTVPESHPGRWTLTLLSIQSVPEGAA